MLFLRSRGADGGCSTIPMGLCYGTDSWALTLIRSEPAGRYSPPSGRLGGHKPARVCGWLVQSQSLDRFPFKCEGASLRQQSRSAGANGAEGVSESVVDLSRHSLAAKGGIVGCLSGPLVGPGRASTLILCYSFYGTINRI